jgi:hypothetical protein
MTHRGNEKVAARQRARERRLKLDADRLAREERIDAAVGDYDLVRDDYDTAKRALADAEVALGRAVAAVLAEGEPAERVAALCELTSAEVRRLSRLAGDAKAATQLAGSSSRAQPAESATRVDNPASADVA